MLTLYRRHKQTCPHTDRYLKQDVHRCPVWVEGLANGVYLRRSLKVSSWEKAEQLRRELENGKQTPKLTIKEAFEKYIAECIARNLSWSTISKHKLLRRQFEDYARSAGLVFLSDVSSDLVRSFRASWKDGPLTAQKKLERLRSAFRFFVDCELLLKSPAANLKAPICRNRAVEPFSPAEQATILQTAYQLAGQQIAAKKGALPVNPKTGTLAKLLLHTGLRITDAAMLTRERIKDERLFLRTAKTGRVVTLPLPPDLLDELERIPSRDLFHSPLGSRRGETVSDYWRDQLTKVFDAAGIAGGHPHRFRHSLAVNMLNNGSSVEDVALVLGNSPQIVSKHYSAFVSARQERLDAQIMKTWTKPKLMRVK
jgi:integrase